MNDPVIVTEDTPYFFRFYGTKRDVSDVLQEIIPHQWTWSRYAIVEAPRDQVGSGGLPVLVLVKDQLAAAKVRLMVQNGNGNSLVGVKHYAPVPNDDDTRRKVLYGAKSQNYPWEENVTPEMTHIDQGQFVERKKPLTGDDIDKSSAMPIWTRRPRSCIPVTVIAILSPRSLRRS